MDMEKIQATSQKVKNQKFELVGKVYSTQTGATNDVRTSNGLRRGSNELGESRPSEESNEFETAKAQSEVVGRRYRQNGKGTYRGNIKDSIVVLTLKLTSKPKWILGSINGQALKDKPREG